MSRVSARIIHELDAISQLVFVQTNEAYLCLASLVSHLDLLINVPSLWRIQVEFFNLCVVRAQPSDSALLYKCATIVGAFKVRHAFQTAIVVAACIVQLDTVPYVAIELDGNLANESHCALAIVVEIDVIAVRVLHLAVLRGRSQRQCLAIAVQFCNHTRQSLRSLPRMMLLWWLLRRLTVCAADGVCVVGGDFVAGSAIRYALRAIVSKAGCVLVVVVVVVDILCRHSAIGLLLLRLLRLLILLMHHQYSRLHSLRIVHWLLNRLSLNVGLWLHIRLCLHIDLLLLRWWLKVCRLLHYNNRSHLFGCWLLWRHIFVFIRSLLTVRFIEVFGAVQAAPDE
mmetsp:Transcript_55816/g.92935  ORF Transcript_55816/g.92935 Transcript_55816/m.92935 type:complete len:340 (+) Transcript_55816:63-1082(+)